MRNIVLWFGGALACAPAVALGAEPEMFGLGAANAGMGGGVTALAADPYAAYYNPAGLTQAPGPTLAADLILGQASLQPFSGVVYDTTGEGSLVTASGAPKYGPIGSDYRVHPEGANAPFYVAGIQFAGSIPIGRCAAGRCVALGIAGFVPQGGLARIELQDPYLPYYVMYKDRNDRIAIHPALGVQPLHDLRLGVGLQVMAAVETSIRATVHADIDAFTGGGAAGSGAGRGSGTGGGTGQREIVAHVTTEVDQLAATVKYRATPVLGALLNLGAFVDPADPRHAALERFGVGVSFRGAWSVPTRTDVVVLPSGQVKFNDQLVILSALSQNPIALHLAEPVAFYNPAQLATGIKAGHGPLDLAADLTWTRWSRFQEFVLPNRVISIQGIAGLDAQVETGRALPPARFHDTWTLRAGGAYTLGPWPGGELFGTVSLVLRAGVAFVPSPVPDQTALTNFMDSDRRIFSGGLALQLGRGAGLIEGPISFAAAFQYHALSTRTVSKDSAVVGTNADGTNAYPYGYPLAGKTTSAGSLWALTLGIQVALDPS